MTPSAPTDRGGTTGQARAAALVTVSRATGLDDARELLAMLGLHDDPGQPTR
jgi:hypothetical protein